MMLPIKPVIVTDFIVAYQRRINDYLPQVLPPSAQVSMRLNQAMRYSVLNGGKRLRPLLVYAIGLGMGADERSCDRVAAAIELVHCFSLVHDDLPAMDDDDLRRGVPTCHKEFDEATAVLAGDALLAYAFDCIASAQLDAIIKVNMIATLAKATGAQGMVAGQMLDLAGEQQQLSLAALNAIHQHKTGRLIQAGLQLGAMAAGCASHATFTQLADLGNYIGLAFQIQDDILDVEGSTAVLGKTAGSDEQQAKATYPAVLGLMQAKAQGQHYFQQAHDLLAVFDFDTSYLQQLLAFLQVRES